jgi:PilZ domain
MRIHRRESPRIEVEAMCWEMTEGKELSGLALDLSSGGLRIERPYVGGATRREVQLEIEVPGIDEVMWARGDVCFDVLVPNATAAGGPLGLIRRTGYRIARAAQRDMRMLREVVHETYRVRQERLIDQVLCSCYGTC